MLPNNNVNVTCYGSTKSYKRNDAIRFFLECAQGSEGSEQSRYLTILAQLMAGKCNCSDEEY